MGNIIMDFISEQEEKEIEALEELSALEFDFEKAIQEHKEKVALQEIYDYESLARQNRISIRDKGEYFETRFAGLNLAGINKEDTIIVAMQVGERFLYAYLPLSLFSSLPKRLQKKLFRIAVCHTPGSAIPPVQK